MEERMKRKMERRKILNRVVEKERRESRERTGRGRREGLGGGELREEKE